MIPHTSTSSTAAAGWSASSLLCRDESKLPWQSRKDGRVLHEGLHVMERSIFFGENLEFRVPAFTNRRKITGIHSTQRDDKPQKLPVSARALERRPSGLDKWPDDGSPSVTRWDKVKSRYSPKEQWKPSKSQLKAEEQRLKHVKDRDPQHQEALEGLIQVQQDTEAGAQEEPAQRHERFLAEAKKRAIAATNYLKSVDVKKLFSSTGEQSSYYPLPPITGTVIAGLGTILLFGIIWDALIWRLSKGSSMRNVQVIGEENDGGGQSLRSRAPSALSVLLERDLRRKESVEWVNMVIGKLWNLYRRALENWLVSLLQPIIDDLEKPDYVKKVEVRQFFLGDEPLTLRTVERRTSRRADDLQYHIGVRYTGGARLLLAITLKKSILSLTIPVGVRGLDVDAEVWVKLRMLPSDPWVGQATWAFVTLPKIKLALAPFRLLNLMAIPFLSIFLAKLLTEDLPMLFVRPNKNVVDFLQGRAVGPVSKDFKDGIEVDGSRSFSGELSLTLIEARRLSYIPYLKTDPYCIFVLGEQVRRSKKNSQTSIIGPPGAPVWNQDFQLLVVDQKTQYLSLTLHDTIGFTTYPVGSADIDLRTLQDTVPVDRRLTLKTGWGLFPKRFAGELILRLTYKAYVDEDVEGEVGGELIPKGNALLDVPGAVEQVQEVATFFKEEAGKVAEFFQEKDLAKEMFTSLSTVSTEQDLQKVLPILGFEAEDEKKPHDSKLPADSDAPPLVTATNGSVKVPDQVVANPGDVVAKTSSEATTPAGKVDSEQVKIPNQESNSVRVEGVEGPPTSQVLLWLAVATGVAWIIAVDLNLNNLFNP